MSAARLVSASAAVVAGMVVLALEKAEAGQRTTLGWVVGAILLVAGLALHLGGWRGAWGARAIAAAGGAIFGFGLTRALQADRGWPIAFRAFTHPDDCVMPPSNGGAQVQVCASADPVQLVLVCAFVGLSLVALGIALARRRRR